LLPEATDSEVKNQGQGGLGRFASVAERNAHWERSQMPGTAEAAEAVEWKRDVERRVRLKK
jgi:hypothetical protein